MIQGIHHVCLKADTQENYTKAITFYTEVLGCSIKRQWDSGIMLDTGHGLIEIFNQADIPLDQGVIRHFALATDCVDDCVAAIQKAGYPITVPCKEVTIPSEPPFPIRIAFCQGPMGEEIESFQEL